MQQPDKDGEKSQEEIMKEKAHVIAAVLKRLRKLKARSLRHESESHPNRYKRYELRKRLQQFMTQYSSKTAVIVPWPLLDQNDQSVLLQLLAYDHERIKLFRFLLRKTVFLHPDSALLIQRGNLIRNYALLSPEDKLKQIFMRYYRAHYHCSLWGSLDAIEEYERLVLMFGRSLIRQHDQFHRTTHPHHSSRLFFKCLGRVMSETMTKALDQCKLYQTDLSLQEARIHDLLHRLSHSSHMSVRQKTCALLIRYRTHLMNS